MRTAARTDRAAGPPSGGATIVRRRCAACEAGPRSECEECDRGPTVRRRREAGPQPTTVPTVVRDVLRSSGRPLDAPVRERMEHRLGHSFGAVRVHADARAAEAARAIGAQAYAAGSHVVFGRGRYAPGTPAGDQLLAHELVHVVQQGSARVDGDLALDGAAPDAAEREARRAESIASRPPAASAGPARLQRLVDEEIRFFDDPLGVQIPEHIVIPMGAPPDVQLDLPPSLREPESGLGLGMPPLTLAPLPQPARVIRVSRCEPDRALTWSDFQGTPAATGFSAETAAAISKLFVGGRNMYRAVLNSGRSWVRPLFGDPTNRASNNCGGPVSRCEQFFTGLPAGHTGTFPFEIPASHTCPAATTLAQVTATVFSECESVIGANCDATRVAESARLLAHEQGHFDITCTFANKANDALNAGSTETAIDRTLTRKLNQAQSRYDTQTRHGCIAGAQAAWEADITAGLPAITIP